MCRSDTQRIYMDGTFYACPSLFDQLYVLHCFIKNEMFPVLFVLMPDRKKDTYIRMFALIKKTCQDNGFDFNPKCFQVDYEIAVIQAVKETFPRAKIQG